jgi:hypothetical protein
MYRTTERGGGRGETTEPELVTLCLAVAKTTATSCGLARSGAQRRNVVSIEARKNL